MNLVQRIAITLVVLFLMGLVPSVVFAVIVCVTFFLQPNYIEGLFVAALAAALWNAPVILLVAAIGYFVTLFLRTRIFAEI